MDSVSQLALGAAVGIAVMGRRTAVWKAALWGGLCGTLPDLDAFIDHGDPVSNMTLHRAESHAIPWLTLFSPVLALAIAKLHGETDRWRRWWLAVWLALITHPLLDWMTVYGTQLALPFTDHPFAVGSIFIIDPLYTLPLLVGTIAALAMRTDRRWRWNAAGLVASTLYLAWSVFAQQHVRDVALRSLERQGIAPERVLVTPAAFQSVLWRVVVVSGDRYHEGFYSLLDATRDVAFDAFPRGNALYQALRDHPPVARLAWFNRGFYRLAESDGMVRMADLRMGQEPTYTFEFAVGRRANPRIEGVTPRTVGRRPEIGPALRWLWRRLLGEPLPPPRPSDAPRAPLAD